MAGIKFAACREPPRNVCYFDVTDVIILIHTLTLISRFNVK